MGTVEFEYFRSLAERRDYPAVAAALVQLEADRGSISISELGDDPESAISQSPEVDLEYATSLSGSCSVYGFYRYRDSEPSTIFIHPSLSEARDNFTIVHEYGHHVQRHHPDWANYRYSLPTAAGNRVEELVADAFAAAVLIPEGAIPETADGLSAVALAALHSVVRASRSAVASRVVELASTGRGGTVVVCDQEGRVIFARAAGDDVFAPARDLVQPSLAELFQSAADAGGHIAAPLPEGLRAVSGWTQTGLRAEVAVDHTGAYAFVVIQPEQVYGRVATWDLAEHECANPACEAVFTVDDTVEICDKCRDPKCPDCNTCSCEPAAQSFCTKCFMALSLAELSGEVEHECA